MGFHFRAIALLAACCALAAGGCLTACRLLGRADSLISELAQAARQADMLDAARVVTQTRGRFTLALTQQLLSGRLTLPEAICRLRDHPAAEAVGGADPLEQVPGHSREERCGRVLIRWAMYRVPGSPEGVETIARLEEELRLYLATLGSGHDHGTCRDGNLVGVHHPSGVGASPAALLHALPAR